MSKGIVCTLYKSFVKPCIAGCIFIGTMCARCAVTDKWPCNIFQGLTKKNGQVRSCVEWNLPADSKQSLKPLCPTRWTVCTGALKALLNKYGAVREALNELSDESGPTGAKAAGFFTKLENFESLFSIYASHKVFAITEQLSTSLQHKNMTGRC